jgi:hypothetical protein
MNIEPPMKTHVLYGAVLALLAALLPSASHAQEKLPPPRTAPPDEKAAVEDHKVSVVTLGTTKEKVDSLLGTPRSGWDINCLCRSVYIYTDGTKVFFLDGCAISACPNGLAVGSPGHGYVVEKDGRRVFFEPLILRGVHLDGPMGEMKHQVEDCFFFGPPTDVGPPAPPLPWIGQLGHSWPGRNYRTIDTRLIGGSYSVPPMPPGQWSRSPSQESFGK